MSTNTPEAQFAFEELFFSRTDERGIILAGNTVFQRISMYAWDEILNKPHNLIRHADMPKAVFWLLWHTIKQGQPIGAYVKNRAKDGRYYWVFAIVTPIDGGFLSVRLKPSSPVFELVKEEYAALLAAEQRDHLKPHESGAALLARLKELGFEDYGSFMAHALTTEITARDAILTRPQDRILHYFDDLVKSAQSLLSQAEAIFNAYERNAYVPFNLRVQAAQLGQEGATIGVISNNYNIISGEIKSGMDTFVTSAQHVARSINEGLFLIGTARIQREVLEDFERELAGNTQLDGGEIAYLEAQQRSYQQKALSGLKEIEHQAETFHQACIDMKRLAAALEVTRIMGKVESARMQETKDGLNELVMDLETFQHTIADGLRAIDRMNIAIQHNLQQILRAAS